jgi:serine/threonine protein kinase
MSTFTPNQLLSNRYNLKENIGKGGFADVYRAEDTQANNTEVAVKILSPQSGLASAVRNSYLNEFTTTLNLSHQYLLTPKHYGEFGEICYIIMPLCRAGSLDNCILESNNPNTENRVSRLLYHSLPEMASEAEQELAKVLMHTSLGLEYIHSKGILHNDVKPGNILVSNSGDYMLSDFGISSKTRMTAIKNSIDRSQLENEVKRTNSALSIAYSAAELFGDYQINTAKTDIFSLGVTLYEVATGNLPWMGQGGIVLNNGATVPNLPSRYSKQFNQIIRSCMDIVPENRPTAKELSRWADFFLENGYWDIKDKPKKRIGGSAFSLPSIKTLATGAAMAASVFGGYAYFNQEGQESTSDAMSILTGTAAGHSKYNVAHPIEADGVKKGVIELGKTGFNSYVVTIDGKKNWRQENMTGSDDITYETTTFEDTKMSMKNCIARMLDFGVRPQNIHFIVRSGIMKEDLVVKIKEELIKQGYYVNAITPDQEAAYTIKCVIPTDYFNSAFALNIGETKTKMSFVKNNNFMGVEADGANYFNKNEQEVYESISASALKIPIRNTKTCFIVDSKALEFVKQMRQGNERFTILKSPDEYTPEGNEQKAALNIYRAIANKTNCKEFIFDWDANFTIGFLLSN